VPRSAYIILLVFLVFSIAARLFLQKPKTLPRNVDLKLEATIKSEPKVYETGQVLSVADAKIYAGLYPRYRVGDRVRISGKINDSGKMFQAKVEKIGEGSGFSAFRSRLREKISTNISSILGAREAALVSGAVIGVDNLGQEFRDNLTKTGTIHVVVVSGQNLMIVSGIFMALAPYIGRRRSLVLASVAVFVYALLAGFEPPVLRAAIMVFAATLAMFFGRQTNVPWILGIAALVIVFLFPQAIFEVSFQLTFAATLGIVTLGKYLEEALGKLGNTLLLGGLRSRAQRLVIDLHGAKVGGNSKTTPLQATSPRIASTPTAATLKDMVLGTFVKNAAVATSAYLFTAPVIIFYFGRISPVAPLANLLVAEAVFPMMVLGFLVAGASLIFMPLAQILAYFAYVPAFYFSQVVRIFAALPFGQYSFGQGNIWFVAIFYILLFWIMFVWRRKTTGN